MELVLVLPLFLILVFSIVEFSMLMSAQTRVANACQSGARMMSLTGASPEEIDSRVRSLLGPKLANSCQVSVKPGGYPGDVGYVSVRVPMKNASPDLLWITGYSLQGRSLDASTPMVMERCDQAQQERYRH
jgi:hypothetical protein